MGIESEKNMMIGYNIDNWFIQFPQEWKMSLDKETNQVIFDADKICVYVSTMNFERPETDEIASVETVSSFVLQAFDQQGVRVDDSFSNYYPKGFVTYAGTRTTEDGYDMIAFAICTTGCVLMVYIVGDTGTDFEKYTQYIKRIERN